jgi:hypothetical protein
MAITRNEVLAFMRRHRIGVQATAAQAGGAQAAVVGIAVNERLEVCFDTLSTTRKYQNLRRDPRVALVVGWDEEQTVQYEGVADTPVGAELEALKDVYYGVYPDGRERANWPGLVYVRLKPRWIRYSDFRTDPPLIVELSGGELGGGDIREALTP